MAFTGLLSVALVGSLHLLTGDVGFDLWDEGFLWYGVKRTAAGEVPLRDFQSYLPGRYYWAAAWSWILGDGILALRLSNNLFRVLGLWLGLLAARRVVPHAGLLLPIGAVLALWMFPQHKPVEASFSLALVYVAVRLVEDPSPRWHFLSGSLVGFAMCFGPNIGLYGALALLFAILLVHERRREGHLARKLAVWCAGVVVGLAPLLGLMAFARGFATSLGESVLYIARHGVNLPRPVPWPWRLDYESLGWVQGLSAFSIGTGYLLLAATLPLGLAVAWGTRGPLLRQRAVFIACVCVGFFFAHHASVRSDAFHLAESIQPLLLGLFAVPAALGFSHRRWATAAVWAIPIFLTLFAVPSANPALTRFQPGAAPPLLVPHEVAGDPLRVPRPIADELTRVERAVARHVPPNDPLFIASMRPGLYPLLGRVSPVWEIYFLWVAEVEREQTSL